MWQSIKNIFNLGIKELCGLRRDILMTVLIIYSVTFAVYTSATGSPDTLSDVAIAFVDNDCSQLSKRLTDAFIPPQFITPVIIRQDEIDMHLDTGRFTFVVVIPPSFERDVRAGKCPEIQLNVDATQMSVAFNGAGYIQNIINSELNKYLKTEDSAPLASFVKRNRFNENLTESWFSGVNELINTVTMLAILLTGAALIRERERGTLEHLLVMPVTPFQIMMSKVWSMGLVVLVSIAFSLIVVIQGILEVPVRGSVPLFLAGVALHLFAVTSMGIFLACIAQNMPQLGMLMILILMPMQMLSGGGTPVESMPDVVRYIMKAAPTTHFVELSQSIIFRGAGLDVVWKPFAWLIGIGAVFFFYSLAKFKKSST